jgi:hypothetical protein
VASRDEQRQAGREHEAAEIRQTPVPELERLERSRAVPEPGGHAVRVSGDGRDRLAPRGALGHAHDERPRGGHGWMGDGPEGRRAAGGIKPFGLGAEGGHRRRVERVARERLDSNVQRARADDTAQEGREAHVDQRQTRNTHALARPARPRERQPEGQREQQEVGRVAERHAP